MTGLLPPGDPLNPPKALDSEIARFTQALELYRSSTASFVTGLIAFSVAAATLIGISINSESWGIALVSLIIEPLMYVSVLSYDRRVRPVLGVAKMIEMAQTQDCALSRALITGGHSLPPEKESARKQYISLRLAIVCMFVAHLGFLVYMIAVGWTFGGKTVKP